MAYNVLLSSSGGSSRTVIAKIYSTMVGNEEYDTKECVFPHYTCDFFKVK
jgi:hypothetical protein